MDQVFQTLIDRSRPPLDLETIKTILGTRRRPRYRARQNKSAEWEVAVERPVYDLTIFKLRCGKLTLKIYTKGEGVLRIEAMAHNTQELKCGRSLEKFPDLVSKLKRLAAFGQTKVGGIDFNKPRIRWVVESVLALSSTPGGFTASELARQVQQVSGQPESTYTARQAGYDLKKLRGKQMVPRRGRTLRYEPLPEGLKALTALVVKWETANGKLDWIWGQKHHRQLF